MPKTIINETDILEIIRLYQSSELSSTHKLATKFKTTHKAIKKILIENGVDINHKGGQIKYKPNDNTIRFDLNKNYVAICKKTKKEFNDYTNCSGALVRHIQLLYPNIKIPTKYIRNRYYKSTNIFWHEEFFDIIEQEKEQKEILTCPYCGWTTVDTKNISGSFSKHLKETHNITIVKFHELFPNYLNMGVVLQSGVNRSNQLQNKENFIICSVCGVKFKSLTLTHLKTHNLNFQQYRDKYPDAITHSETTVKKLSA